MRKLCFVFLLICLGFFADAQEVKPIYFYGDQITVDKDKATSYAIYGKLSTEDLWMFKRYDLDDNLLQTGSYADGSLTVAQGKFVFYMDVVKFNLIYNTTFNLPGKTRFVSQQGSFLNGFEQGKWLLFYPDGNIFNAQNFVDGKMNGPFVTYNKNGIVLISGIYVDGEKDGEWLMNEGKLKQIYKMGVLLSSERVKKAKNVKATAIN